METEKKYIRPILLSLIVAAAPLIFSIPLWIMCWCCFLWGYMYYISRSGKLWPKAFMRRVLTGVSMLGLLASFDHMNMIGGSAFVSIIAMVAGLKPLEIQTHRDRMVAIFLSYFIIITTLIVFENLAVTLYMFFSVLVATAALVHINHPEGKMKGDFQLAGWIMVQALPMMIALFLLFPRVQGSFWGMNRQSFGQTGFAESLALGDVASLAINNDVAFRVEFKGAIPATDQLYWRGIVFWNYNGRRWSRGYQVSEKVVPVSGKHPVEYIITMEPHGKKWVFSLGVPAFPPDTTTMMGDYTLRLRRDLRKKYRYRLKSYVDYRTGEMATWEQIALKLPEYGNERSRELAEQWEARAASDTAIVQLALTYFKMNHFVYTLKPPVLSGNEIDDFLFNEKRGFCEHYAAAFAFLMRAAGIPARIVGGYAGGTVNPYGNYLIVNQSDAHAWVEVWLEGKGWVRVDPTSAVVPERISRGISSAVSEDELPGFLRISKGRWVSDLWRKIEFAWDAVSTRWDIWFVGYSFWEQKELLSRLGIMAGFNAWVPKMLLLITCLAVLLVAGFVLYRIHKISEKKDEVQALYDEFCTKMAQKGLPRKPAQGPFDYAQMIGKLNEKLQKNVTGIITLYVRLRYANSSSTHDMQKFKSLVKHLKPD